MKEKNPVFVVSGSNEEGPFEVIPDNFFIISRLPKKVVITGKVSFGQVSAGDKIVIKNGENEIHDRLQRVEVCRKEVSFAVKNELVGMCLTTTSIKMLRKLNTD